ncbi:MAG: MBL fold metallo-hydrolase [Candidatus Rokubacteria bacterium]|nr:MBL fold metallo-hydrolase [Candidatus Rokubacteria bacterium]MBI3826315.1 MBL fold metallo-hydrolase [Candidatus Rokubacteria bacterium]
MKASVGAITVTRVIENGGPTRPTFLFPDAVPEALQRHRDWLMPHFMAPDGRFIANVQTYVVQAPGLTMLVDTCVGNDKVRQIKSWNMMRTSFLEDLTKAGFPQESIDLVLCTHLHVDHVGWNTRLVDGRWVPTFPRARYVFEQSEWAYWSKKDGDESGALIDDSVRPVVEAGRADLVTSNHRISEEIWLEPTPGHTPGHVSVHLASRGAEAVITGDLMHHPVQCGEPDWHSHFDDDAVMARATRKAFCARYADRDVAILGTHFAGPGPGRILSHGEAWRFRAA